MKRLNRKNSLVVVAVSELQNYLHQNLTKEVFVVLVLCNMNLLY